MRYSLEFQCQCGNKLTVVYSREIENPIGAVASFGQVWIVEATGNTHHVFPLDLVERNPRQCEFCAAFITAYINSFGVPVYTANPGTYCKIGCFHNRFHAVYDNGKNISLYQIFLPHGKKITLARQNSAGSLRIFGTDFEPVFEVDRFENLFSNHAAEQIYK